MCTFHWLPAQPLHIVHSIHSYQFDSLSAILCAHKNVIADTRSKVTVYKSYLVYRLPIMLPLWFIYNPFLSLIRALFVVFRVVLEILLFHQASPVPIKYTASASLAIKTPSTSTTLWHRIYRHLVRPILTMDNNSYIRLDAIDELCRPNCKIKDRARLELLLNSVIAGGHHQLQVVTDFDFTLTKQKREDGIPVISSFGMFAKCKSVPATFSVESTKLFKKYRPIEICPKISIDEKRVHMIEWWRLSTELLQYVTLVIGRVTANGWPRNWRFLCIRCICRGFALNPRDFEELAEKYSRSLRDGTKDMMKQTYDMDIPVLVFSAGLGEYWEVLLTILQAQSGFL